MERPLITAEIRESLGTSGAQRVRAKGLVPAVFYGPRTETLTVAVDPKKLAKSLHTEAGGNVLIDLDIEKEGAVDHRVVMVKEVQTHPLKGTILHADFYEVSMDTMVTVEVPILLVGKAEGVKLGGILEHIRRTAEVQCLPADIPHAIELDVTALKIGDSLRIQDLKLEKGKILSDPAMTVAAVVAPEAEEKPKEEAAVEGEAAPEAEVKEEKKEEK
jgi:large subunit ribosomal protein L25